jgi:hypothetical protein
MIPKLPLKALSLALLMVLVSETSAQKRQTPRPTRRSPTPATTAPPSFDTLLGASAYKLYAEVRGVGQLLRSNSISEILDPVLKLAEPPKEFRTLVKWLNTHADDVMTSRMLVATWPTARGIPDLLVAIEFDSPEEAAKFGPQLNAFLPKVLPTPPPEASPSPSEPRKPEEEKPSYYLQHVGSLILITPTPLNLKNLRPARSKLLSDDTNFRVARTRFSSEQLFVYVNVNGVEVEEENRRGQYDEEEKKRVEEQAKEAAENPTSPESSEEEKKATEGNPEVQEITPPENQPATPSPTPDQFSLAMAQLTSSFFQGQAKWPDAVGFGLSLENDSFDVRALMVSAAGEKPDPIPFFPNLIPGPQIVPESASILPADTELFASFSLDLPQIYAAMSKPREIQEVKSKEMQVIKEIELEGPFAEIEKQLKIKLKDDLLPLLGSEVVVSIPVRLLEDSRPPKPNSQPSPAETNAQNPTNEPSFVVAVSLRDKEVIRALIPRVVDSLGFKGASALAQTERRGETELVTYGNMLSYAFIENFLVISADSATTKHVVDSYLKHETLSSDMQFKNSVRWQPRQLQAQIYVSPALMESYKNWANAPSTLISDQTREILSRLSMVAQPITYSLSNDGMGTLHELHVPKNLVLMAVAGFSAEANPSPIIANERTTIGALQTIAIAESQYKSGKGAGSFGTIDQLVAAGLLAEDMMKNHGYKIEVMLFGDKFQVTAVPDEYGKTGKTSYFIDHSAILRGADHGGAIATVEDNPIY